MNEQQLKEIFELLEKSGFNPMLCDTPVPYFENGVKAGIPADIGDVVKGDYAGFVDLLNETVPEHGHLPIDSHLMCFYSCLKRVKLAFLYRPCISVTLNACCSIEEKNLCSTNKT